MNVLFVASGKLNKKVSAIIENQGNSLQDIGINISYFAINNKGLLGYLEQLVSLRRYLKRNPFDIIHAHYGLAAILVLFAKQKQKLVVSFMGDDIVGSNKRDGSITKTSLLLAKINIVLSKWFYSYSIVKSAEMLSKCSPKKVALIPNGVNMENFYPLDKLASRQKLNIDKTAKILLFVSNPSRIEKNYSLAQDAVKRLSRPDILLLPVYGVDQSKLLIYYNASDVVVLTSFHEGSPNVIKEAMACNCPIVSTNVGDVTWLISKTKGCYLTTFDSKDLAENISLALKYSDDIGKTNGRDRIIELGLDSKIVARKIVDIYLQVLN